MWTAASRPPTCAASTSPFRSSPSCSRPGREEFDEAKRKAIYHQLEQVAIDQVPMVGLALRSQGYAMRKDVTGFTKCRRVDLLLSGETFETTSVG